MQKGLKPTWQCPPPFNRIHHRPNKQSISHVVKAENRKTWPLLVQGIDDAMHSNVQNTLNLQRLDESADMQFYSVARFAAHVDSGFDAKLKELYNRLVRPQTRVLDLCSSFDSHLPETLQLQQVIGHGLNESELLANPRLTSYFLQDLNANPILPQKDDSVDAVLCCAGIMYLTQPVEVLKQHICDFQRIKPPLLIVAFYNCFAVKHDETTHEIKVARVLAPGGTVIVSFSSHCFCSKAVGEWLQRSAAGRVQLVQRYMVAAGLIDIQCTAYPPIDTEATVFTDKTASINTNSTVTISDPFYAVVARKSGAASPVEIAMQNDVLLQTYPSLAAQALAAGMASRTDGDVSEEILQQWKAAYLQLAQEATSLGIPPSAIPALPDPLTAQGVRAAKDRLSGILASFMSSGL